MLPSLHQQRALTPGLEVEASGEPHDLDRDGVDLSVDGVDVSAPPLDILRDAIESSADESGWAHLGQVGRVLSNRLPDFDARNFGYRSTGAMLEELEGFEIRRQGGPGQQQTVYVRVKPGA